MNRQNLIDLTGLAAALAMVCWLLPWHLMVSPSAPTGGDTPSHFAAFIYFKEFLLPQGRLWGWYPGALAGMPLFEIYFPLPFLAMAGLASLIPPAPAFKLLALAPALALPPSLYLSLRRLGLAFPGPLAGAMFSLCFLLAETNKIWGGNLPSMLVGEFCYAWAFCLAPLFLSGLPAWVDRQKGLAAQALLLAAVGLCHAYALLFVLAAGLYFLGERGRFLSSAWRLLLLYTLGFLLLAFWLIPFVWHAPGSSLFKVIWPLDSWQELFPQTLTPVLILAALGVMACKWKGNAQERRTTAYLLFWVFCATALYLGAHHFRGINIRFAPFGHLAAVLLAAQAAALGARFASGPAAKQVLALFIVAASIFWSGLGLGYLPSWLEWNNAGVQGRPDWSVFLRINRHLKGGPAQPRVAYEHSQDLTRFGSSRAFESLPLWSGRSTLEGLYNQASPNTPFVFYVQSEISQQPSRPLPEYSYSHFNLQRGLDHLALYNVSQFIAMEAATKEAAQNLSDLELEREFEGLTLFRLKNTPGGYATQVSRRPLLLITRRPRFWAYQWLRFTDLKTPLVFVSKNDPSLKGLFAASLSDAGEDGRLQKMLRQDLLPQAALPPAKPLQETIRPERIELKGLTPGRPVLISISFHPAWQCLSGERVFQAAPCFMLVFPQGTSLTMVFRPYWPHWLGLCLSAAGIMALGLVLWKPGLISRGDLKRASGSPPAAAGRVRLCTFVVAGAALLILLWGWHEDAGTLRRQAARLEHSGQTGQARVLLEKIIQDYSLHSELPGAYLDLGRSYLGAGDYTQAAKILTQLNRRFPDARTAPQALYSLGLCYNKMGRYQKRQEVWGRLRRLFPHTKWADKAK
ncbi:MAG: 6-pyruvoyl-tetrahydropterin synthase-related protein [Desulfarculaceae bacterium]